ncbi:MAG: DUF1460 domain-containing protein [Candidatus Eisenbacteria bacterium]|nr:DUF1460 domain-containing protein [Candidatus Eisenbacteria bacterium]
MGARDMQPWLQRSIAGVGICLLMGAAAADDALPDSLQQERLMRRYEQMVQFNLDQPYTLPSATIDSLMQRLSARPVGERIAGWADYFHQRGDARYRFGLAEGGYVSEGRLVDDFHTDCVLFFYRTTELGRSSSAVEAVQFAFGTRFYGATLEEVVSDEGRVDYDSPVHLDYTVDIIRSGIWGQQITATLGETVADEAGTDRYPPGTVHYVPKQKVRWAQLQDGDIVYFVSDEATDAGRRTREVGAIIGHLGIVEVEGGQVYVIHAASKGLAGFYESGRVVKVPLKTYLERVETFKGVMATRIEDF